MLTMAAARRSILAVLCVSILVPGCSLYRVRSGNGRETLDGIPFFPRVGVCRQETAYVQPVYRVAVQAGAVTLFEAPVVAAALGSPEMRSLRALVAGGEADVSRLAAAFETLTTSASNRYDPLAAPVGLFLGANTLFTESQVDYRAPLYLNVTRPVLGSAAADARLAPDGTLTQAGAEIKDTTAEALLAAVPVKELVTALIPGDRSARLLAAQGGVPVMLQLVTEPQFVKHVYWIVSQGACPGGAPPISAGLPGSMYRRELQQTKP